MSSEVRPLRAIHVGLGGQGRHWANVCRRHPELVEVVAFVEPAEAQVQRAVEQLRIPRERVFPSLRDAVAQSPPADFVLDVTPPSVHHQVAMEAFAHGLHYLGEKPMSDDFRQARRAVQAAREAGRVLMVAQNYRFGAVPRTTRRLLAEGRIGTPEVVSVGFYREWAHAPGTHYVVMPYPLLTDMGIHHFDLLRYVLGREPVRVHALSWNPSWGWHKGDAGHTAVIEFEGGLWATHHALGCSVGRPSPWNGEWRIEGPEGSLTWEDDQIWHTRVYPRDRQVREQIPPDPLPAQGQDAVLAEFVAALRAGRQPECHGEDNLRSLALTFAAVASARERRPVDVAEILEG
jgi:predicted dehydrogenase